MLQNNGKINEKKRKGEFDYGQKEIAIPVSKGTCEYVSPFWKDVGK